MPPPLKHEYSAELQYAVNYQSLDDYYYQDELISPDDIFLASYPRSGSHFVRFILLSILQYQRFGTFPEDFSGMRYLPDVHKKELDYAVTHPRVIKTHFPYDPRYRNVIHLIRDPRDVVVSYYYYARDTHTYLKREGESPTLGEFVDLFLEGKVWPCDLRFHTNSFTERTREVNYILILYENLIREPKAQILELLRYLGITLNEQVINRLAAHSSFENMVRLHNPESAARGNVPPDRKRMLRRGTAGSYRDVLNGKLLARMEEGYKQYLKNYGYA